MVVLMTLLVVPTPVVLLILVHGAACGGWNYGWSCGLVQVVHSG
jgi:hypothetical protein